MSRARPFLSGLAAGLLIGAAGGAAGVAWHWNRTFATWYLGGVADRANIVYQIYSGRADDLASRTLNALPTYVEAALARSHPGGSVTEALWLVTAAYEAADLRPPPKLAARLRDLPPRPRGFCPKPPPPDADDIEGISRLEEEWNQAHLAGDVDALDRLWADELVMTVPAMPRISKADAELVWRSGGVRFTRYDTTDVRIRVYGDSAVVTGRLRRGRDLAGPAAAEDWQYTKVYVRRPPGWRVVAFHASAGPPP